MTAYPSYLQIETVAGMCSTSCVMCPIRDSPRTEIMSTERFRQVLESFLPHKQHLKYLSLCGLGETLLDKDVAGKIAIASQLAFPSIAIYTNATHLSESMSNALLANGLQTLAVSLDGATKETHEAIRPRTNFDRVVRNVLQFVRRRNETGTACKVVIKMVRQQSNAGEWEQYFDFWSEHLDASRGDLIGYLDVHNYAGNIDNGSEAVRAKRAEHVCRQLDDIVFVRSDGQVALCCGDVLEWFRMGDVLSQDPIEAWNNDTFAHYREYMHTGRIHELKYCDVCSSTVSDTNKGWFPPGAVIERMAV